MIEIPEDPLDLWITRAKEFAHKLAFQFMDEVEIINYRMSSPNNIVTTEVEFEPLDSERRMVARQLDSAIALTHMQLGPRLLKQTIRRLQRQATRRASHV